MSNNNHFAIASLFLFGSSLMAQTHTVNVTDRRPLLAALDQMERTFEKPVNYEDVPCEHDDDLEPVLDPRIRASINGRPARLPKNGYPVADLDWNRRLARAIRLPGGLTIRSSRRTPIGPRDTTSCQPPHRPRTLIEGGSFNAELLQHAQVEITERLLSLHINHGSMDETAAREDDRQVLVAVAVAVAHPRTVEQLGVLQHTQRLDPIDQRREAGQMKFVDGFQLPNLVGQLSVMGQAMVVVRDPREVPVGIGKYIDRDDARGIRLQNKRNQFHERIIGLGLALLLHGRDTFS